MDSIIQTLQIYNGDKEDLLRKKYNIWLGVSISLKPYSEELAIKYLKLIATYSKDTSLVFIGDEIAAINYRVLEEYSPNTSLKKALKKGDAFVDRYSFLIKTLSKKEQQKIKIIRWKDVWGNKQEREYHILKKEYLKDHRFRKEVEEPIISYLTNSKRTMTPSRISELSEYILKELPFLLDGLEYQKIKYKAFLYPTYGKTSLSKLVSDIQQGKRFTKLKNSLGLKGDHLLADSPILENTGQELLESA